MRAVLLSDVRTAARALRAVPAPQRAALCARLFLEADWADRHTRRLGRVHPLWGNGTLLAAAGARRLAPPGRFDDAEDCACFQMVVTALLEKCTSTSCKQGLHAHMGN